MKDSEFKTISHSCDGYEKHTCGNAIQKNYSPDYVLKRGNEYIIIEHETEPNRKTIIADIFKAAFFLKDDYKGFLIIVMTPKGTSSFESYPKHALPYYKWLKDKTNLKEVIFVHESQYFKDKTVLVINEEEFTLKSTSLNFMLKK
jgi:hypothetical protein